MNALTKTEWYEGGQLPARPGVYEVEHSTTPLFRYFDGERWYFGGETPREAMYRFQTMGQPINDGLRWRGLLEKFT